MNVGLPFDIPYQLTEGEILFEDLNPQGFYPGENLPKLSKAEVLFFGLLMSGAIKLDRIPTTKAGEELDYFDEGDYEVMNPLNHDLELLADLYEKCRRFAARRDEQK